MEMLAPIFSGWDGYQTSLMHAVTPLTGEQLDWRPAQGRRSLGELIRHLIQGRVTWFSRMGAPGIDVVEARVPRWIEDDDGTRRMDEEAIPSDDAAALADWLALCWLPVERVLNEWTVDDLFRTYRCGGYVVSRQWTIWRVLSHDIHHGGQIAAMLASQGIEAFELRAMGGHIVSPPLAEPAGAPGGPA